MDYPSRSDFFIRLGIMIEGWVCVGMAKQPPGHQPVEFAMNQALRRIENEGAWPVKAFRLELEYAGVYQNVTGNALSILLDNDRIGRRDISVNGESRPYFTRPKDPRPKPSEKLVDSATEFEEFLTENGHFADLAVYIALSKIFDELSGHITGLDVYPEGPYPAMLQYPGREPDGVIRFSNEHVPIEVYNGGNYLSTSGHKYDQIQDLSSDNSNGLQSNPMLINRRCDDDFKAAVRRRNGMVVDTDLIIASESAKTDIQNHIDRLQVSPIIKFLPEFEDTNGDPITGDEYYEISNSSQDIERIRPPNAMASEANKLPNEFLKRIRGGVQLQYVNSIYREDHPPIRKDAALVVQAIYNRLLREGGVDKQDAIDDGWTAVTQHYRRLKTAQQRQPAILDEARSFLGRLKEDNVLLDRNGKFYARNATHPQPSLTF